MLAVFHAAGQARLALARADKARPAGAPQKVQGIKKRLQSLLFLIGRFTPAIIRLGILVGECTLVHRNLRTGWYAPQVMRYALLLILSLRGDAHDPYVNTIFIGMAMWYDFHDALPAAVFVEERWESLLSRLSCITTKDKAARSFKDWETQWQSLCTSTRPGQTPVHL